MKVSDFFDLSEFAHRDLFSDCTYVWEALQKIPSYFKGPFQILGDVSPQAYLINPDKISIGEGSVVEPGAYIEGPCIIGKGCTIRHGAYIRGNLITGDHCVIGHTTEVKNAIFLNGAKAAHFAYVGDSILGNNVNLGAGTKLANLRFDNKTIVIAGIETGIRKFGAIVGDGAQTGCNSVLNPGTLMEKNSTCRPCSVVGNSRNRVH